MERFRRFVVAGIAVCVLGFGVSEALAGQSYLRTRSCTNYWNWCALSEGGQANCNDCCGTELGGSCGSFDETPLQACKCYAE